MGDHDFGPGRPLISDRAVYAICGTSLGLALLALLAFVARRDIGTFQVLAGGIGALVFVPVWFGTLVWAARG